MRTALHRLVVTLLMLLMPLQGVAALTMPWCGGEPAQAAGQHVDDHDGHHGQDGQAADAGCSGCEHCAWCASLAVAVPPATAAARLVATPALDPLVAAAVRYSTPPDQPYRPPLSPLA